MRCMQSEQLLCCEPAAKAVKVDGDALHSSLLSAISRLQIDAVDTISQISQAATARWQMIAQERVRAAFSLNLMLLSSITTHTCRRLLIPQSLTLQLDMCGLERSEHSDSSCTLG